MAPKRSGRASSGGTTANSTISSGASTASSQASGGAPNLTELATRGQTKAAKFTAELDELIAEQRKAQKAKMEVNKQIRNQRRKTSRLKKRARLLSNEDLLTVVAMRSKGAPIVPLPVPEQDSHPDEPPVTPVPDAEDQVEDGDDSPRLSDGETRDGEPRT